MSGYQLKHRPVRMNPNPVLTNEILSLAVLNFIFFCSLFQSIKIHALVPMLHGSTVPISQPHIRELYHNKSKVSGHEHI